MNGTSSTTGASPPTQRPRAGRIWWLALPAAIGVFVGASSPWVAQRTPRFIFPALAAAGAALIVFSFVNSLAGLVRCYRGEGPFRPFALAVNLVAMTFLVAFPLTHVLRATPNLSRCSAADSHGLW